MNNDEIEAAFASAETAVADGRGLKGTGFWRAINALRRDRAVAERFADRAAAIDRRAFERGVPLRVGIGVGTMVLTAVTLFGIAAIWYANTTASQWRWAAFLVGFGALVLGSHTLAHIVVGRLLGIRFTHVFVAGSPVPEPGGKTDYASYLRVTPVARAVMHASGAVVTKIIPFALLPFGYRLYDRWSWVSWLLVGVGVFLLITDVLFSTKVSDWMKVRRELRAMR